MSLATRCLSDCVISVPRILWSHYEATACKFETVILKNSDICSNPITQHHIPLFCRKMFVMANAVVISK